MLVFLIYIWGILVINHIWFWSRYGL